MRMWLCDPKILCQKHLCGEHVEMHMFLGSLKKNKKMDGFFQNNLFEPRSLFQRHEDLKIEMINRGYNHESDICEEDCACVLDLPEDKQYWEVDRKSSLQDLLSRCPDCRDRFINLNVRKDKKTMDRKLIKNAAQCVKCGDIIESIHRHDFKRCSCGSIFVDGGKEYIRRGGELEDIKEMCEWDDGTKDM